MNPVATPAGPVPRRRIGVLLFDGVTTLDVVEDEAVQHAIRLLADRSRRVVTVGGDAMDLALALVEEDHGPDVAQDVARLLLASTRPVAGRAAGTRPVRIPAPRPTLAAAIAAYVTADPTRPCSLGDLARHASISTRHLHRVVRRELGMTPMAYVMSLRLDVAVRLLESGTPVATVAHAAGFGTPSALRRSFAARFGTTPSEYQRRSVPTGRGPDPRAALA